MDVDGVLTNGQLYNVPDAEGKMVETKGFDSQDGIGLQWLELEGHQDRRDQRPPLAGHRGARAPVQDVYVYQGHIEKIPILEEILADAKSRVQRSGLYRRRFHRCGDHASRGPGHRHGQRARPK